MKKTTQVGLLIFSSLAALISFYLEYVFVSSIVGVLFAFLLTITLEGGKIFTVLGNRMISEQRGFEESGVRVFLGAALKVGLVGFSIMASIAMMSKSLDAPNLQATMDKDRARVNQGFDEKIALLDSQKDSKLKSITGTIKEKYQNRYRELDSRYLPEMVRLKALRDAQFKNRVNGVRKGSFYLEHDAQLSKLSAEYKAAKANLQRAEDTELNRFLPEIENSHSAKVEKIFNEREATLAKINPDSYSLDTRSQNEYVASFLKIIDRGLGVSFSYLAFSLLFSIFTACLLELIIYLGFSLAVSMHTSVLNPSVEKPEPVLEFQNAPAMESETIYADDYAEIPGDGIHGAPFGVAGPETEIDPATYDFLKNLDKHYGALRDRPDLNSENPYGQG